MKKDTKAIKIIKKDGTKEDYNVEKVVIAVKKSANRALITFTDEDIGSILLLCGQPSIQHRQEQDTYFRDAQHC